MSKALLELQIELNQLQERFEQEKFDLMTKLMTAENETVEMEMREQTKARHGIPAAAAPCPHPERICWSSAVQEQRINELSKQLEEALEEKKGLAMEFVALKTSFVNMRADFEVRGCACASLAARQREER